MPLRNSFKCRSLAIKRKFRNAATTMPFYASCASLGCFYRISKQIKEYEKYYKYNRQYNRVINFKKWDKALRKSDKLKKDILIIKEQFLAVKRKLHQLRKIR